jgi:hypothetical protein
MMAGGMLAIPGFEALKKTGAAKNAAQASAPARSVLVRQKGAAGAGAKNDISAAKAAARSGLAPGLAKAHQMAMPVKGAAGKEMAQLKKLMAGQKSAGMKAASPARSVLVKDKGLVGGRLGGAKNEISAAKAGAKSSLAPGLAKAKQAAAPVKGAAGKEVADLKKVLAGRKSAAMKATSPARSVLVKEKGILGKGLQAGKGGLAKDLAALKKAPGVAKAAQAGKAVGGSADAKKLGRLARLARQF